MKPTQEQVIAWAREARFYEGEIADDIEWFTVLANLAYEAGRADENKACAEVCELMYDYGWLDAKRCAREIRSRREQDADR